MTVDPLREGSVYQAMRDMLMRDFCDGDFESCDRCHAKFLKEDGSCTEGGNVCRDCVQKEAASYFDEWKRERQAKDEARDLSGPRERMED